MIQRLRRIHRGAAFALVLLVPAILLVGLSARSARGRLHGNQRGSSIVLVATSSTAWKSRAIISTIDRKSQPPTVILQSTRPLGEPDLLLYWASTTPTGHNLPANARFLGVFAPGRPIPFPPEASPKAGYLVLYSLAHKTITDTAPVEEIR